MSRLIAALAALMLVATLTACDDGLTPEQCAARGGHVTQVPGYPTYVLVGKVVVPIPTTRDACLAADGTEIES